MRLVDFKLQSEKLLLVYYMINACSKDKNTLGNIILPKFLLVSWILPDIYRLPTQKLSSQIALLDTTTAATRTVKAHSHAWRGDAIKMISLVTDPNTYLNK